MMSPTTIRAVTAICTTCLLLTIGCSATPPQASPRSHGAAIQSQMGRGAISDADTPAVELAIAQAMKLTQETSKHIRILTTAHSSRVSYVLYNVPNNEGLAIVTKDKGTVQVLHVISLQRTNPEKQLVSYNTVTPGNPWDPDHGVLFGMVHSPYITRIEVHYRDGQDDSKDVSHTRGFIFVRSGNDPRFVQIVATGKGGIWWTHDTR